MTTALHDSTKDTRVSSSPRVHCAPTAIFIQRARLRIKRVNGALGLSGRGAYGVRMYLHRGRGQVAAASATCCAGLDDLQRRPSSGHDRKGSADRARERCTSPLRRGAASTPTPSPSARCCSHVYVRRRVSKRDAVLTIGGNAAEQIRRT